MKKTVHAPRIAQVLVNQLSTRPAVFLFGGLAIAALLAPGLGLLTPDFTHRGFFFPDDPVIVDFDKFERQFGNDDRVAVAVHSPSGLFDPDSAHLLRTLTERMWLVEDVIRVDSLSNYNWVHADGDEIIVESLLPDKGPLRPEVLEARRSVALEHEILPKYFVSLDARTAMASATLKPGIDEPLNPRTAVEGVFRLLDELESTDHEFHVVGMPALNDAFRQAAAQDLWLNVLALVITGLMLGVLLRSLVGVGLAFGVVLLSIISAFGAGGYAGIAVTNITAAIPQILIALSVANAVHILLGFLTGLSEGEEQSEAARGALLKNFVPTFVTSFTTSIGFFTFLSADLKPIIGIGFIAGVGTLLSWLYTYSVLGALLFMVRVRRKVLTESRLKLGRHRAELLTDLLAKNRSKVLVFVAVTSLVSIGLSTQIDVNSDPMKYFPENYPIRVAHGFIEDHVGGIRGVEISIDSGEADGVKNPEFLRRVEGFQDWVSRHPFVTRTVSLVDVLKTVNRALNGGAAEAYRLPESREAAAQQLLLYQMNLPAGMNINDRIGVRDDTLRLSVLWKLETSNEFTDHAKNFERKAKEMGLEVTVTGKDLIWRSMNGYVVHAFVSSIALAIGLISLTLIVFFSSVRIGLLAMLPNSFPLLFGGALIALIGKQMDIGVALVMAVCLGIAVDDTIHVLSNFLRLRREGESRREAVIEVLAKTGPALMTTSAILVGSFGILVLGTFIPNIYFGLLTAVVLFLALVIDLTFVPALLLGPSARH